MADGYDNLDPTSLNVLGVEDLVSSKVNRVNRGISSGVEGAKGDQVDELELKMDDLELLQLASTWTAQYAGYEGKIKPKQNQNKQYYLGTQKSLSTPYAFDDTPIAGNLIFEAEETFLAAALSKNPEPVVWSDDSKEGAALADDTKTMLQFHADTLQLRRKLALMVRQWSIYYLGVAKHGWDEDINDIKTEVRRIQNFIFDVNGYVDVYGDFCGYLGERIVMSAGELMELFPEHKAYILLQCDGKLGTQCVYTEWWTDEYTFSTFKDIVLEKKKNPNFNYDEKRNHFAKPKKPYTFLSVFSLGERPHDITGLIEQNIPNQNLISKEIHQIDYNISRSNNSTAFSENNFNQQTAKQATQAWIKGHNILVPPGVPISEAIADFPAHTLPDAFFKNLENNQMNLRTIFGTMGITSQSPNEETTARGMILNQQRDNSRIGGGIGDQIEQVADNIFNWWAQMYHVFYDVKHFATIMGVMKAVEYVELSSSRFDRQLVISVSPDSMKPKDEITEMNQATSLWEAQAIGLKTFLTLQKLADPQAAFEDTMLWMTDKMAYFAFNAPELFQRYTQFKQSGQVPPEQGDVTAQPQGAPAPIPTTPPEAAPSLGGGEAPQASLSQVPLPQ